MYKVLIVDDEALIRDGLKCIMDWEEIGFSICGEAGNGEDALSLITQTKPDLVLMDIRMPKVPGIEVVKISRQQGFNGKFIIISGYSDFKYAQEAIRYGVDFYLTKPIDEDELLSSVQKIKEDLDTQTQVSDHIELYRQKAKDVILHELILGNGQNNSLLSPEELEELELDSEVYQIVIYENFNRGTSLAYSFADLLKVSNKDNHTFYHFQEDQKDVLLLKGSYALHRLQDFVAHYNQDTPPQKDSPMDTIFLAYGRPVEEISQISFSYQDAHALMRRRFFCIQGQHTLGYEDLPDIHSGTYALDNAKLQEYTDYLVGYLQTFNRKKVADTLFRLEKYLYNVDGEIAQVKLFLTDLYLRIKEKISLIYNNVSVPFSTNSTVIDFIEKKYYLYEIIQFLSEQFEMFMNATGNPSRSSILDDILYYIDHNYQSNIKLETIAPLFGYNSAYLGKIFNKTVGESFNSYVDHMRIEHSKDLLTQGHYKVYEIAEKVGYRNVDYFHKKFRKYVGESPAEYRKKNGGGEDE